MPLRPKKISDAHVHARVHESTNNSEVVNQDLEATSTTQAQTIYPIDSPEKNNTKTLQKIPKVSPLPSSLNISRDPDITTLRRHLAEFSIDENRGDFHMATIPDEHEKVRQFCEKNNLKMSFFYAYAASELMKGFENND